MFNGKIVRTGASYPDYCFWYCLASLVVHRPWSMEFQWKLGRMKYGLCQSHQEDAPCQGHQATDYAGPIMQAIYARPSWTWFMAGPSSASRPRRRAARTSRLARRAAVPPEPSEGAKKNKRVSRSYTHLYVYIYVYIYTYVYTHIYIGLH